MLSTRSWPEPAIRVWELVQRFQKFLVVGAIGFAVNQIALLFLQEFTSIGLRPSGYTAVAVSMGVTFALNEMWTWHDRGRGSVLQRAMFYIPINTVGLLINTEILVALEGNGLHYLVANIIGAGVAAIWNFVVNNAITWRA